MAKQSQKNQAAAAEVEAPVEAFDYSAFGLEPGEMIEVGAFPPYVEAAEGFAFYAAPLAVDRTDPNFPRILWKALAPLTGYRGSKIEGNQVEVSIEVGDLFTSSEFGGMKVRMNEAWQGCGCVVRFLEEIPHPKEKGKTIWKMSIQMPKVEHEKMLANAKALGAEALTKALGKYGKLGAPAAELPAATNGAAQTAQA